MKTLRFLLINLFIRDYKKSIDIINRLDGVQTMPEKKTKIYGDMSSWLTSTDQKNSKKETIVTPPKQKTKRDELIEGLNYLKSKPVKSVKDKESIYTLEMLLKNNKY